MYRMILLSATIGVFTAGPALAETCQKMGGTAIFEAMAPSGGFVVAMTGEFRGGVFARVVGSPHDLGNGRTEYNLEHFFSREDGATISTRDKSVWIAVPGESRVLASTTYHVIRATGPLEGATGEFHSWGSVDTTTGQGVLRFSGEACRS